LKAKSRGAQKTTATILINNNFMILKFDK